MQRNEERISLNGNKIFLEQNLSFINVERVYTNNDGIDSW